jgi:hypothetical protein
MIPALLLDLCQIMPPKYSKLEIERSARKIWNSSYIFLYASSRGMRKNLNPCLMEASVMTKSSMPMHI